MGSSFNAAARWRPTLFGAAAGLLAATSFNLADIPLIKGEHALGLTIFGTIVGALVGAFALWTIVGWIAVVLAVVTAVIVATPISGALAASLIRTDSIPSQPLAAIVVLGTDVNRDGFINVQGVERMLSALQVARRNHPRVFITTRVVNGNLGAVPVSTDADQRALITLGGDTSIWRVTDRVMSTHDEALGAARIVPPSSGPIGVVTSPTHTKRACAVFEGVGFRVVCIPSESRQYPVHHLGRPEERFHIFFGWVYETLGWMEYRARGWIKW